MIDRDAPPNEMTRADLQKHRPTTPMGYVPNALSVARVPLSLSILFVRPFSAWFFLLYVLCGITDALDGFIARRYHAESQLGAVLDSIADFVFFLSALYVFLTAIAIPPVLVIWALSLVIVRGAGLIAAFSKFQSWAALHTYAYKTVGFVFFCFPLFYMLMGAGMAGTILCGIATYATAEEIYINTHSPDLDLDIRGLSELRRNALPPGK